MLTVVVGCAPPSTHYGTGRATRDPSEIPSTEIESQRTRFATAYDIVRALRPNMLVSHDVSRGPQPRMGVWQSRHGIKVYLDGLPYGGLEALAMIPATSVSAMRWLSAVDATTVYGTGNTAGAILVTSRR